MHTSALPFFVLTRPLSVTKHVLRCRDALAEMEAEEEAQAASGAPQGGSSRTRTQTTGQSGAIGAPNSSSGRLGKAEVSRNAPGEDLLPAAMGADSPMTDVDSVE